MKRLAWLTDIHLNFLRPPADQTFLATLAAVDADALLLTGDIAEAHDVTRHLASIGAVTGRPVYFVLGNHDYYHGSIAGVRARVRDLCRTAPGLHWLPDAGVVPLTAEACLVGHDGWGDGRFGDYYGSHVRLNDWRLIEEFGGRDEDPLDRITKLHTLGDEAAAHFRAVLPAALGRFRHVVVATHVPPFREACLYEGKVSDDHWLPHFTCKAVGDALVEAMAASPDRRMTVLCGHTHGEGDVTVLPNLRVLIGGAVYGSPAVQMVLAVD